MNKELKIGNVKFDNPFFLAPLAGITDSAFRRICKAQGAGLVYSEMVSGKGLYYNDKNTERLLKIYEDEMPVAYQIFGSEPEIMAITAKALSDRENCIIDINMGCPVPKIVKNGEGSALLKDTKLAAEIVKAVVSEAKKPVTVKTRIGWDDNNKNVVKFAEEMEKAGASAIAVHGRTREQYYSGKADWGYIKAVKNAVSMPVIGNGDIFASEDAIKMLEETNCDFIMIGRGALGNPWIFNQVNSLWKNETSYCVPTTKDKIDMMKEHFRLVLLEKGEYVAVREMRKHAGWYLKGMKGSSAIRGKINTITSADELINMIEVYGSEND